MAKKPRERNRLVVLSILSAAVCATFVLCLMSYQVAQGAYFNAQTNQLTTSKLPIKAARGEIIDSAGEPLAANKAGLNIVFYYSFLPKEEQNAIIAELIALCEKNGEEWYDPLPITTTGTPEFLPDQEREVSTLKKKLELNVYATAENCMFYMQNDVFKIEGFSTSMTRKIAGVRYGMVTSDFSKFNSQYVFAEDVSPETALKVKEMSDRFPGVDIAENDIRNYPEGTTAPHVVGIVGAMSAEEYEKTYKASGYKLNTEVGKFGIEKVMETYLHGVDGVKTVEQNKKGDIISEKVTTAPQSGSNVVLTINAEFQRRVQQALVDYMAYLKGLNDPKKGSNVKAGAVSVLDVKTGAVLAMVTYPSYDINDFFSKYSELNAEGNEKPMINRVTDGLYRPGSTFKTVVAAGALEQGIIEPHDTLTCTLVYRYYDYIPGNKFHPSCLGYHGKLDVAKALTESCNFFFYDVGRQLGIDKINIAAKNYGLGTPTGLEIPSAEGVLTSPEYSKKMGGTWNQGNVVQAAIGQMDTMVSPLQMSIQALTLANQGKRLQPHLIKEVRTYDDSEVLYTVAPKILSDVPISDDNFAAIQSGMIEVAKKLKNPTYGLADLPYEVAIKTGSPQQTTTIFNSAVVGYAPVGNPEIAISVMLEDSQNASWMVRPILDAYYDTIGKK